MKDLDTLLEELLADGDDNGEDEEADDAEAGPGIMGEA